MADRKFTIVNGSKTSSAPTLKKVSHRTEWILALVLICFCILLVGMAVALGRMNRIGEAKSKRQTTCLTWEDQGKTQLQCGGKLYVEKIQ